MRTTDGLSPRTTRREPVRRARRRRAVALVAAVAAVGAAAFGIWQLIPRPVEPAAPSVGAPATAAPTPAASPDATSEAQAAAVPTGVGTRDASPGAAAAVDAPTEVRVPSVGLALDVIPVGVREDGQMDVPELVREVGWYRFGPEPGATEGSSVLAAHVDSDRGPAPMSEILDAVPGEAVEITTASGDQLRYRITTVEQLSKDELPLDAIFARDGDHVLRLITCGGEWDAAAGAYEDNIVVTAVPDAS
ncbi:class F sortase [Agrococcus lahaulensis]|nr:class F sortase [Agrococcus lahaulensis]